MHTNTCSDFPPRILILDGDKDIRQVLIDLLNQEGYCVDGVGCSAEALGRMSETRYSSIVVNAGILHGGGSSILQLLKDRTPSTAIIVLTGYLTEEMTIGLLRNGAFAYLPIPYSACELKTVLQRAMKAKCHNVDPI